MKTIGDRIRETRKAKTPKMTLTALADETGIAISDLSAIENNVKPCYDGWLKRIADALGVTEAALRGEEAQNEGV